MEKHNNKYSYYSGNLSNVNRLVRIIGNYRHATVLDQFSFYSLNSQFIFPKQERAEGWFRIGYKELANKLGYRSDRSIKSLVKKFISLELLEKTRPLIGGTNTACLRITEKTKHLLGISTVDEELLTQGRHKAPNQINTAISKKNFEQHCTSESEEISLVSNEKRIKEKDINTITPFQGCEKQEKRYNVPNAIELIFKKIGERLPETQKTMIWAAICNLQKQHNKKISNITEFTAWVAFSIINASHQLKSTTGFNHQLNKLMKIARSKEGLQKPRGFHNHWDIGKELKAIEEQQLQHHAQIKAKPGHKAINIIGGQVAGLGYTVAKKAKELWQGEGRVAAIYYP